MPTQALQWLLCPQMTLHLLNCHSEEEKVIIKNDFEEKAYTVYRIWKEHPTKGWDYSSLKRLLKRYKETGIMDRKKGSGRHRSVVTEENQEIVEELICSKEDEPHTHTHTHTHWLMLCIYCAVHMCVFLFLFCVLYIKEGFY